MLLFCYTQLKKYTEAIAMSQTDLLLIGIILGILIFAPARWGEKIENAFGKIFTPSTPDVIDVEKICKNIRKTPER